MKCSFLGYFYCVNIFDSCMSTNCCHSLNWGWIEMVTDLPRCVIFIVEGTLCLIAPSIFYWIQQDIFSIFYIYVAVMLLQSISEWRHVGHIKCSWHQRLVSSVFKKRGLVQEVDLKIILEHALFFFFLAFWIKYSFCIKKNASGRQEQLGQHWGNVYNFLKKTTKLSDCEPATRADSDYGET